MPKLNPKKVITLKAKISKEYTKEILVNPSIRLTAIQAECDDWANELILGNAGAIVEVTAEGLI